MFERYTETARRVIFLSRYMAGRIGGPEIETDHLLLGLLREDKTLARRFLGSPWAAEDVWKKIVQRKPIRERVPGPVDLPLSSESKRALAFAAEEADLVSNKRICSQHLLLGLLREERSLAAEILHECGVHLTDARVALERVPHNDSAREKFEREKGSRPDEVAELKKRIKTIKGRVEEAIAKQDFALAKTYSDEESKERETLFLLYQQHGLLDWILDD
jgi:ATP-dependent Clp protease ATP-binding subunit ClpC